MCEAFEITEEGSIDYYEILEERGDMFARLGMRLPALQDYYAILQDNDIWNITRWNIVRRICSLMNQEVNEHDLENYLPSTIKALQKNPTAESIEDVS